MCSPGTRACLGMLLVGKGENVARNQGSTRLPFKTKWGIERARAVEDQSAPIPEEILSKVGGSVQGRNRFLPPFSSRKAKGKT
jgi:hypothetical protein